MANKPFIIAILILASTIAATMAATARGIPRVVKTNLENLPMHIGDYQATEDHFAQEIYKVLNADKNIYRHYRSPDGRQVDLYIGYYGTSKGGRSAHNPYACFSGAGWAITNSGKMQLSFQESEINYMLTNKSGMYQVVLHWYQRGDRIISQGWRMNLERFKGLLLHNRNDGAFVRVSVNADQQKLGEATRMAKSFATLLVTLIPEFWPEER